MEVIQENTNLMAVFKFYDPDYVANAIVEEMNQIVNDIAPTRIIQTKKEYIAFHNEESKNLKVEADESLNRAITNNDKDEWKHYQRIRNKQTASLML